MVRAKLATVAPVRIVSAPGCGYDAALLAALAERRALLAAALDAIGDRVDLLADVAALVIDALRRGNRILVAGNGGSAAEAQHFAAELVGRFKREREALPAIALTADSATLTAIANDYGYEEVFARQVAAHGRRGDVLLAFSTSGESENLVRAARAAAARGIAVVALTGGRPNRLAAAADLALQIPVVDTPLTQELQTVVLHLLCDLVESACAATT